MEVLQDSLVTMAPLLELYGDIIIAALTVPVYGAIKRWSAFVKGWRPLWQQTAAVTTAAVLAQLAALLNSPLPETLQLFTGEVTQTAIAAGMALAIHAGKKASG